MSKYIPSTAVEQAELLLRGHCPECFYPPGNHYDRCWLHQKETLQEISACIEQLYNRRVIKP